MKNVFLFTICLFLSIAVKAQSINDEMALIQSVYGIEKKQLIADYMKLTETESAQFWAIYDEYEVSRKELGKKRMETILDYANSSANLTNEKATLLVNATLANHAAFNKLLQKTFQKMSKSMSALRAAQFVQVESYLENVTRLEIADQIPLIGELENIRNK